MKRASSFYLSFSSISFGIAAGALGSLAAVFAACADDVAPEETSHDAGSDTQLIGEGGPPELDASVPPGDTCGDRRGLELESPWPLRGGCPKRGNVAAFAGPQSGDTRWTAPIPAGESSPAVDGAGYVWIGTTAGDILCLGAAGEVRSGLHTGGPIRSSPAIAADGTVVIGGGDGMLYGVRRGGLTDDAGADADAGDGGPAYPAATKVFSLAIGATASSPLIGPDGTIYIGTLDGKLVAVEKDGSKTKWTAPTNDALGSSPALGADGTIYVGSSDRKLYAIAPDGATKWTKDLGAALVGSPAVGGDDAIYVGASDGKLHALESSGEVRWSYSTDGAITGSPAIYAGTVYVGSDDKKVHALSSVDGERRWVFETLGAVATPVIANDGTVYAGSADGRVYALRPTGLLFFAVNAKGKIKGVPAIDQVGTLTITTETGIAAFGP